MERDEVIMLNLNWNWQDIEAARIEDEIEARAIIKDSQFEDDFNELQKLSDQITNLQRKFNLSLKNLKDNPPADTSMLQWNELKGLKPFPVNEY